MISMSAFAYDQNDSDAVRLEKNAILLVSGSCVVAGCGWALMYFLIFGWGLTTALPLLFVAIVSSSLLVSHISKNIRYAIYTQIACMIYITSFVQWSIGGVFESGLVLVWALCGPIVALIFLPVRQAAIWFGLYAVNILITVLFDSYVSANGIGVDDTTQRIFVFLNILTSSLVIFAFAGYFVNKAVVAERTLTGAVNAMGEGFAYFDKDDRLAIFNEKFTSISRLGSRIGNGTNFEDMLEHLIEVGFADNFGITAEQLVERGMRMHRNPQGQYATSYADGTWVVINDTKTSDGGSVLALTDITNLKRAEEKLAEKEAQLRAVLDNLPVFISLKDRDMKFLFVNKIFEEWSDVGQDEVIGKSLTDIYGAERADEYIAMDQKTIIDGTVFTREFAFKFPDGQERDVVATRFPVTSSSGEVLGLGTINYDITERKRAENELAENRAQLASIIENITEGLVCYDADQRLILSNSKYREFYGYSNEDVLPGTRFEDLVRLDVQRGTVDDDGTYEKSWTSFREGAENTGTRDIELKDGRWLQVRERSTASGTISVQTDITGRKQAEQELAAAHKRSNDLLLNAIPEVIAERLKENPTQLIADRHEDVSILFADVAGFTTLSANQDPAETVNMLNALFSEFDDVCDEAGIEKIRTIGDGYMVVGGAPQPLEDHAVKMIEAAKEFLKIAHRHNIDIRIGLNGGEVVAGIVGTQRFHYDVWGDAVNVAARMETTSEVGNIHISSSFAERLGDKFPLIKRDPVKIKGKGTVQTWFVEVGIG